ncbi:hypothetical protein Agub_g11593 [Astrephomene gubernaculifera]|uniref:phytol kinase n=1 Tax=Astrephomene gubernaculifera TaxID=47775 RepID=A0AAD3HQM4_9CHLO|nr:hypothetical protein Agub_g11593 [Astrephomene gubernaculifera]
MRRQVQQVHRLQQQADDFIPAQLRQFPAAVERLLRRQGKNVASPFLRTTSALKSVKEMLTLLLNSSMSSEDDTLPALLSDYEITLLRLVGAGVRVAPGDILADADGTLGLDVIFNATAVLAHYLVMSPIAALPSGLKLLRMHTLQACSRQLAAAADVMYAAKSLGGTARAQRQQELATTIALGILRYSLRLLQGLICCAVKPFVDGPKAQALQAQLRKEFAEALGDSSVMDHASRLLLMAAVVPDDAGGTHQDLVGKRLASHAFVGLISMADSFREELTADMFRASSSSSKGLTCEPELLVRVRRRLSGCCTQHAMFAHGLAALCAMDGGSSYSLPPEVLRGFPAVYDTEERPTSWDGLATLLYALENRRSDMPPGRRAALDVSMRLGRLAVASGRAWAEQPSPAAVLAEVLAGIQRGRIPPAPVSDVKGPSLSWDKVPALAARALQSAWQQVAAQPPEAPGRAAEVEAWWRLGCEAASVEMDKGGTLQALGLALAEPFLAAIRSGNAGVSLLSPAPPLEVSAALSGGLLPCLERLLRRAGNAPDGPQSKVLQGFLWKGNGKPSLLDSCFPGLLLSYGDVRQTAALVTSLKKVLMKGAAGGSAVKLHATLLSLAAAALKWMRTLLLAEFQRGNSGCDGVQRLQSVASYAAAELLPACGQLLRLRLPAPQLQLPLDQADVTVLEVLSHWLSLLALRCGDCDVHTAAASVAVAPRDDGGWRPVLLGTALQLAPVVIAGSAAPCRSQARSLVAAFRSVAGAFPPEVRQAALGAAAEGDQGIAVQEGAAAAAAAFASSDSASHVAGLPWGPEQLRGLVPLLVADGEEDLAEDAEELAGQLDSWSAGGRGEGEADAAGRPTFPAAAAVCATATAEADVGRCLPPVGEMRRLLRTCAHPGCGNLTGESEAELPLRGCAGCGEVGYCSRECQVAHWRAPGGHKEACRRG